MYWFRYKYIEIAMPFSISLYKLVIKSMYLIIYKGKSDFFDL